jgi:uncharacterized protein YjdB
MVPEFPLCPAHPRFQSRAELGPWAGFLTCAVRSRSWLVALLGLTALCATPVVAQYTDGQNVVYTLAGSTASVSISASVTGSVTIPATITTGGNTYSVTSIENYAFRNVTNLTSVTIPATVTAVGGAAFKGCSSLSVMRFLGNAPTFETGLPAFFVYGAFTFDNIASGAVLYYSASATGWGVSSVSDVAALQAYPTGTPLTLVAIPTVTGVTSSSSNASYGLGSSVSVQVAFSTAVTVSGTPTLTLETGSVDRPATYASGSGSSTLTFTYTVQSGDTSADLDYVSATALALNGGTIVDGATNAALLTLPAPGTSGSLGANKAIAIDAQRPTATIVVATSALRIGVTSSVTLTFSEAVTGFTNADLTIANGTLSAVSSADGGVTWTATFTPTSGITDATNLITLDNTGVIDAAGNAGSGTTDSNNYAIDTQRPALASSITISDTALKIGDTATVTFTFTEAVTGFTTADVAVQNGTLSGLSTSNGGVTWTATLTPSSGTTASSNVLTLDNTGVTDVNGNAGTGTSTSGNYAVDTQRPTLASSITINDTALKIGDTATVTFAFTEAVTGFSTADLMAPNAVLSNLTTGDGGITWTATLTPAASTTASSNVLTLDNTGIMDLNGNAGTGNSTSGNYAVDTQRPTAAIVVAVNFLTTGATSLVTITFSEAVTGFTNADLSIANGTLSAVSSSDGGITWTATLTPAANVEAASNVISLANTGVSDAAGNSGTGSSASNNYAISTLPTPTLTFATPSAATVALGATLTNAATSTLAGGSYGAISYTSDTPSIATVNLSSGVVTGVALGTITITATQAAAAGFNATAAQTYTLTVVAAAPTVTTPTSASITTTSATLGGNVTATGGASLTAVGVVYSITATNNNPQLNGAGVTPVAGTAATGIFTLSATSLTPGASYSYAAYATNSVGTTYSSVGTFTATSTPSPTLTFATPTSAAVALGSTLTNAATSTLSGGSYGAISYTSTNPTVATVNTTTGLVTGIAVGTTTITATQAAVLGVNAPATQTYLLTVNANAPTVTSPTSTSITTTSATLGGNVTATGGATLTAVGVAYSITGTNSNPQLNGTGVTNVAVSGTPAAGVFTVNAPSLTPGTAYSYAAYATNGVGTTYTSVGTFTTTATPSPTLTFATPTAATVAFGATLTKAATSTLSGGGYGAISYASSAPSIATVDATTGLVTGVAVGTTTITATQAAVYGVNAQATQTYLLTVVATAPTVTSPSNASITTTSVTLGGNVTATGGATLTEVGIVVSITATNNNPQLNGTGVTNVAVSGTPTTGVFTVNATSLVPGTAYSYAAYATTSVGTTYTSVGTFTATATPTPTLIFATPTAASVAFGATLTNAATSTLSGGSYGAISYASSAPAVATVNATTGFVTGITVGTTTITATQAAVPGVNALATQSYLLTVAATAPTITSPTSASVTTTTATLGGNVTATGGASLTTIGVVVSITATNSNPRISGAGVTNVTASGTPTSGVFTVNATGLTAGTAYSYAAYATNSAGTTYTSAGTFTTTALTTPTLTFANPLGAVTTIAGTGSAGAVNAIGTAASYNNPNAVAVDSLGNIYVADVSNNLIRKIVGGVTTTLAGSGTAGSQNGTGTAASFYRPYGIALDSAGNVYVADSVNNLIRKISPAGLVSTLAGSGNAGAADGAGAAASFNFPTGVAVDVAGNVYVGDQLNHKIRKITAAGVVTTLAGSGTAGATDATGASASFNTPGGLAVDSAGTVYVADQLNNKVRKVTAAGVVTTLAGSGSRGTIDATGSAASFWLPAALAVDSSGTVYVADQFNQKIRSISTAGVVTTLAGTGTAGAADAATGASATFNNPGGIALDGIGNLIIGDLDNHNIRKVTLPNTVVVGATLTNTATSTLAGGTYGAISYASAASGIASVNATTGVVTGVAAGTTTITATQAATAGTNATASQFYTITVIAATPTLAFPTAVGSVTTLAGSGTAGAVDGVGRAASFSANGLAVDNAGNVYLADTNNHLIRRISPQGVVTTLAGTAGRSGSTDGPGTSASFSNPYDVAVDSLGNVYVADYGNRIVRKIDAGGVVTTLAGTAGVSSLTDGTGVNASFSAPAGVAVDRFGSVYIADLKVRKISAVGAVSTWADEDAIDVEVDASGNVYYASFFRENIGKITPLGVKNILFQGNPNGSGYEPMASVALDSAGNVYFTNIRRVIRKLTPSGVLTTLSGFQGIRVVVDGAGNLYSLDVTRVYKIPSTVELAVGATVTHIATSNLTGGSYGAITYTSSDPSKVTVNPTTGLVTGVSAGPATIIATQAAAAGFNTATVRTYPLVVTAATSTITWATPSAITYGTALSATQLNATGSVAGTITYNPASGTMLNAGTQTLTATFIPTDTTKYAPVSRTVSLTVNKATPTLTWATPSAITSGTALSATQLNASSSVAGGFSYNPASGTIPSLGTQTLTATFTPTDTVNYNSATTTVSLGVVAGTPGAPTNVAVTTTNGQATVSFTAPSAPGGGAITNYTILATATDGSVVTTTVTGSPATITDLTPGKSYQFTVAANNGAGAGTSSSSTPALSISRRSQTITFPPLRNRVRTSGAFSLDATASSGLRVTYTVVSGTARLALQLVNFTGAGDVTIRVSQAGDASYFPAPDVEVTFKVPPAENQAIFAAAGSPGSTAPAAHLALVNTANGNASTLLIVSSTYGGLNGAVNLQLAADGTFSKTFVSSTTASSRLPIGRNIQAEPASYTISGTLVDNVLKGTIEPLGLSFNVTVPEAASVGNPAVGFYQSTALATEQGVTYTAVGPNNEVLVLAQSPTVTVGGLTTLKADGSYTLATTTAPGGATLTGTVNPVTTAATATLTLPGSAPVVFSGLSTTTKRTDRLIGLASRAKVGTGESVLITGVAIGGTESKRVLIRAGGPALAAFGLASTLPNPAIKIYRGSTLIAQNDDWNPADAAEMARLGLFAFANGSKDAAILTTLAPGSYTAHVSDLSGTGTGVALAEIYDASVNPTAEDQRLVSIASRGTVSLGDGALIGGFIVVGNAPKTLLIRGIGPTLTSFGVVGALADPVLTIYDGSEALATNAGWANSAAFATAATQAGAFALTAGSRDAALLVTLKPGSYTAQVKAAQSASSGVALIEIYEVP